MSEHFDPYVLPDDVVDALNANKLPVAIRRLRDRTGLGLRDAKDILDAHRRLRLYAAPESERRKARRTRVLAIALPIAVFVIVLVIQLVYLSGQR